MNMTTAEDCHSSMFAELKLSGGDALMGNTRSHAEHEG